MILTVMALAALTAGVRADSRSWQASASWTEAESDEVHSRRSRAEADIESLKGRAYLTSEGWDLHVSFEVEIEDAGPGEYFDLVFHIRAKDGHGGGAMQAVVPLDEPTEIDDDEWEFEGRTLLCLPHDLVHPGEKIRLDAYVVPRGGGRPLDHEDTTVKTK